MTSQYTKAEDLELLLGWYRDRKLELQPALDKIDEMRTEVEPQLNAIRELEVDIGYIINKNKPDLPGISEVTKIAVDAIDLFKQLACILDVNVEITEVK